jgi:hypothetical protein
MNDKAKLWHYASAALVVLGVWYLIGKFSGGNAASPLASTSVDITSMVVMSG